MNDSCSARPGKPPVRLWMYFTQSCNSYSSHVRIAAKDAEIKLQLIGGCTSARHALREKWTLTQLLDMARSLELAETQASGMEKGVTKTPGTANAVQLKKFARRRWKKSPQKLRSEQPQQEKKKSCFQCGGEYPHLSTCPAKGRIDVRLAANLTTLPSTVAPRNLLRNHLTSKSRLYRIQRLTVTQTDTLSACRRLSSPRCHASTSLFKASLSISWWILDPASTL